MSINREIPGADDIDVDRRVRHHRASASLDGHRPVRAVERHERRQRGVLDAGK